MLLVIPQVWSTAFKSSLSEFRGEFEVLWGDMEPKYSNYGNRKMCDNTTFFNLQKTWYDKTGGQNVFEQCCPDIINIVISPTATALRICCLYIK